MQFEEKYAMFWQEFGTGKKMVLSTALENKVTSRMMSIVALDGRLYFQTDRNFRKYAQLKENPNVALCIDNIQLEGHCEEIGHPFENTDFCKSYEQCFESSFRRYTGLSEEGLFVVIPDFIERWRYIEGEPYMEIFDVQTKSYRLEKYVTERT